MCPRVNHVHPSLSDFVLDVRKRIIDFFTSGCVQSIEISADAQICPSPHKTFADRRKRLRFRLFLQHIVVVGSRRFQNLDCYVGVGYFRKATPFLKHLQQPIKRVTTRTKETEKGRKGESKRVLQQNEVRSLLGQLARDGLGCNCLSLSLLKTILLRTTDQE